MIDRGYTYTLQRCMHCFPTDELANQDTNRGIKRQKLWYKGRHQGMWQCLQCKTFWIEVGGPNTYLKWRAKFDKLDAEFTSKPRIIKPNE